MPPTLSDIKRIISLQLGIKDIGDDDHFLEVLGAESADVMNIIVAVEEKYGIAIKESEIAALQTPQTLFKLVMNRI